MMERLRSIAIVHKSRRATVKRFCGGGPATQAPAWFYDICCIDPFVASPFGLSLTVQAASEGIDRRHATPHRYDACRV